ncbi:alpha/beta hydrolase [Pusillimonas noertemannii]|uniref:alpha/beta hydrolase n=1 Tax=Pusillimonas noertemannii TaxID=305977 RepID=UPI000311FF03|nr:dienelactone hydrolase family protein [Pusillimonas noertemannii]
MKPELLDALELETAPNPTHAVIWLHGLGADGNDFAPIVPELRLGNAPAIRFVFPHAPVQPVTINGGMAMRAWYDIRNADLAQREDAQGILQSQEAVRALIQRENQRGIATGNIVLAGFSQGCAMTLQTGLRLPERLAGLVALSGYLPLAESLQAEFSPANKETPIFMAHGTQDPVVPLQRAQKSCQLLQEMGYSVDWKTYPMPHSVCLEEVNDIAAFLKQVLRG